MRKILQLFFVLSMMLLLLPPAVQAQEKVITGTIISEDNKTPLAGVTVRVKGTRKIAQTDAQGKFSISVKPGETLQITYVGYETTEVKPGDGGTVGVSLKTADNMMGEVVVTAMDIRRNPRELSYSVQKVSGSDIQETQRENFLNSLQGRVAGLTLDQTSGEAGASSSVVLRGFNSLSLSNQPLYVVDGVIMDNSTLNETSSGGATNGLASDKANRQSDYQNRIADINPADIESITVLKGPEATALYGSMASSGAIVITTRRAKSNKLQIQYDNSFRFQRVTRWPETLDDYANGDNGVALSTTFRRFGPKQDPSVKTFDHRDAFFRTGTAMTHNLGLDFGVKESKFRVSGTYFNQKGVVPNNDFTRYSVRISNTTKFFKDKLEISPAFQYVNTDNHKVLRSAGGYMLSLLVYPNTIDISTFQNDQGDKLDVLDNTTSNGEYDNPLWNVYNNIGRDQLARKASSLSVNLRPWKFLTIAGRFGYDTYDQEGFLFFHPQSFYVTPSSGGSIDMYWRRYKGYNHTITATYNKTIKKNFNVRLMGGTMWIDTKTEMWAISGGGLIDSVSSNTNDASGLVGKMYKNGSILTDAQLAALMGNYMDSNVIKQSTRLRLNRNKFGEWNYVQLRQIAYFGEFAVSFKNYAFLNYTHRFEQSSTLPAKNRKYNYPGMGISLILSDMFPSLKKGSLNYWKIRASRAQTARLNSPYSTQSVFVDNQASGGGYSYGFFNNNADLEPEKQKTYEMGTEFRLFNSRLSLDITYYNTLNDGQIIENFRLSYGTGYVLNTQNAGSTRNKGLEITLDYNVMKKNNFTWDMRFNFNRMRSRLVKLPANVAEYYIADTWLYTARGGLTLGGTTTSISGSSYQRNQNGQILISPTTGLPLIDANFKVMGDRNPDFTMGWINNFRYKNWRLTMLWDLKVGGDIFNGTNQFLTVNGLSKKTEDRYTPRVVEGVLADGFQFSSNPTKNTIVVIPAYNQTYYTQMPVEEFLERDVNWFRLRDITLRYTFNKNFIRKLSLLEAFITGNDLILLTNYSGADPAVNGLTAGARGVGAFGYDYGTLPAPMQINIGFRATF